MGLKDTVTKDYMEDSRVFADAFNHLLYDGKPVINPTNLHTLDTAMIGVPYGNDGVEVPTQKFRDELKYLTAMEDNSAIYLLLGIENQSEIHYAMPVKDMVYDALQYAAQVEKTAKFHRKIVKNTNDNVADTKTPNAGEYLSGFYKEDRLIPVITLVMYFGPNKWDGPKSLHEMLSVQNSRILSFVSDYKINLIAPAGMSDDEINQFTTNLREVMLFIKYSKDKKRLKELVKNDKNFKAIERKAARVINTVTGSGLQFDDNEEVVDMCKAIEEMRKDERIEASVEVYREIGYSDDSIIERIVAKFNISKDEAKAYVAGELPGTCNE